MPCRAADEEADTRRTPTAVNPAFWIRPTVSAGCGTDNDEVVRCPTVHKRFISHKVVEVKDTCTQCENTEAQQGPRPLFTDAQVSALLDERLDSMPPGYLSAVTQTLAAGSEVRTDDLRAFVSSLVKDDSSMKGFLKISKKMKLPPILSESWFVPIRFGTSQFRFLCDTGSAVTIVRPDVYQKIPRAYKTPVVPIPLRLSTASGSGIKLHGVCALELELGTVKLLARAIVADVKADGIVGQNFLGTVSYACHTGPYTLPRE